MVPAELAVPSSCSRWRRSTGAIVSRTSTEKLDVATLAAASDARQNTAVVPIANIEPLDGVHETDVTPTASVAAGSRKGDRCAGSACRFGDDAGRGRDRRRGHILDSHSEA